MQVASGPDRRAPSGDVCYVMQHTQAPRALILHDRLHAARNNMIPEAGHPRLRAACSSPRCHWAVGKGTRKHQRRYRRTPRHAGARSNLRGRGHAHSRAPQPAHRNIRSRSAVTSDAAVTTDRLANIMPSHVDGVHVLRVQTYKAFACVQLYKLLKKKTYMSRPPKCSGGIPRGGSPSGCHFLFCGWSCAFPGAELLDCHTKPIARQLVRILP